MDIDFKFHQEVAHRTIRDLMRLEPHQGDRLLDIGANVGIVSATMSETVSQVLAFEPLDAAYNVAAKTVEGCSNVTIHNEAVTNDGRPVLMKLSKKAVDRAYTASASLAKDRLVPSNFHEMNAASSRPVQAVVDDFRPTIVKLDAEGAEYELLPACDWAGVRGMLVEFHGMSNIKKAAQFCHIAKWLFDLGFVPQYGWVNNMRIDEGGKVKNTGFFREFTFVRSNESAAAARALVDSVLSQIEEAAR